MGVASGLSLAFVPFEVKGARGWKRASGGGEVVDGWTKEERGIDPPGVLLRGAREVLVDRHKEGSSGRGTTLISEPRKHQPLAGEIFVLTT
jgi:hypothetical protein